MKIRNFFMSVTNLFSALAYPGRAARDAGIAVAVNNAEANLPGWGELAYNFLITYASEHNEFMIEDVRNASVGTVPTPTSGRAWGAIAVKAAKNGIIERKGFRGVKNVKAHSTPATLWCKVQ